MADELEDQRKVKLADSFMGSYSRLLDLHDTDLISVFFYHVD